MLRLTSFLFAVVLATAAAIARPAASVIVIDRVTIVDGRGGSPIRNGRIVVENGTIQQAGAIDRKTPLPAGAQVINGSGKFAIPGLIDAHIHFDQSADIYTRPDVIDLRMKRSYAAEIAFVRERLPLTLLRYTASGVTGVIDMGGPFWTFDLRTQAATMPDAPRVAVAGPLLGTHAIPELESPDPPILVLTSASRAREIVRRIAERKPDLIKILWEVSRGERLSDQSPVITAAIEEAHRAGIRVSVHALELETAKAALRAGADILAHSVEDSRIDKEFIDLAKKANVIYIPTLSVVPNDYRVLGHPGKSVELSAIERQLGDPLVIQTWAELGTIPVAQAGNIPFRTSPERRPVTYDNLRKLVSAGVRIAVGTDAGNIGTLHGPAIHREMELISDAGMKPSEILVAATRNGAAAMGREKETGTLEAGKAADLVLLDADPTTNVKNLQRIFRVMKAGAWVDTTKLERDAGR